MALCHSHCQNTSRILKFYASLTFLGWLAHVEFSILEGELPADRELPSSHTYVNSHRERLMVPAAPSRPDSRTEIREVS